MTLKRYLFCNISIYKQGNDVTFLNKVRFIDELKCGTFPDGNMGFDL